uniref:SCY domain-containing protein n=1 Tax=Heterorhabditis bacteriophora TaxID=37862 RepID=A0A1I7W8R6_HETBA
MENKIKICILYLITTLLLTAFIKQLAPIEGTNRVQTCKCITSVMEFTLPHYPISRHITIQVRELKKRSQKITKITCLSRNFCDGISVLLSPILIANLLVGQRGRSYPYLFTYMAYSLLHSHWD